MIDQLSNYVNFVMPSGRAALVEAMRQYKTAYGAEWLTKFKAANPELTDLVDIIANYDAEPAFHELLEYADAMIEANVEGSFFQIAAKTAAKTTIDANRQNILDTHAALRAEIDKPRF